MDVIEVNMSKLSETIAKYKECKKELESTVNGLKNSIKSLNGGLWLGTAQKSFDANRLSKLYKNMENHMGKLASLEEELTKAYSEFHALEARLKSNLP